MICKSCFESDAVSKNLCRPCLSDYRYNVFRRHTLKKQEELGKPLSREGKRWTKESRRKIKTAAKIALISGTHTNIRARDVISVFEVTRTLANKILQELTRDGLIIKKGSGRNTFYEVQNGNRTTDEHQTAHRAPSCGREKLL